MPQRALLYSLLTLLITSPAAADEAKMARAEKSELAPIARSHRKIAKWCKRYRQRRRAYRHFAEVLAILPGDFGARSALGYRRSGGEWVQTKAPSKADEPLGKAQAQVDGAYAQMLEAHHAKALVAFRALAEKAEALGLTRRRDAWLGRVIGLEPGDVEARRALGWTAVGEGWARSALHGKLSGASAGEPLAVASPLEEKLGVKLTKRRAQHVMLGSSEPDATVEQMVRAGELAASHFQQQLGLPGLLAGKGRFGFYYLPDKPTYERAIDELSQKTAARKELAKRCVSTGIKGLGTVNWLPRRETAYQLDRMVYQTTRSLVWVATKGQARPWMQEGIAWVYCLELLGTRHHHSVSLSEGSASAGGAAKTWTAHDKWRGYLRELVLLDTEPPLGPLISTSDTNEIKDAYAAASWSLAEYLLTHEPAKLGKYCQALGEKKTPIQALEYAYGFGADELQRRWRAYVLANY